jgi:DNA-binding MarR family transcriptional regulator
MTEFDRLSPSLPQALASALRRLAQLAHMSSWDLWGAQGLTPTQRKILDLLAAQRGVTELATVISELGLTPATAADSLEALEARDLVDRRRSHVDGHTTGFRLTQDGRRCLAALSKLPDPLRSAFGSLNEEELETVYRCAMKMICSLQNDGLMPVSRMCVRCQYFDPYRYPDSPTPHHCHLVSAPFADRHLRIDCPEQKLASPDAQEALWVRFTSKRVRERDKKPGR